MVSARVLEYKPAAPRSFDEVKGGIEALLKLEQATKLATEKGLATVAKLKAGEPVNELEWIPTVTIDRKNAQRLTEPVMNQAFKIDTSKLPAFAGFMDGNKSFTIVQVSRVDNALKEETKKEADDEYKAAVAAEYLSAYGKSLKSNAKVVVNRRLLETSSQQ